MLGAVPTALCGVFRKKEMWENAVSYTAAVGGTCGVLLRPNEKAGSQLTLFFDTEAGAATRFQFEDYVHTHLKRRTPPESIQQKRIFACPECGVRVADLHVKLRQKRGLDWIRCSVCETRISLSDREESVLATPPSVSAGTDRVADKGHDQEAGLTSAVAEMQAQGFKEWVGGTRAILALVFTDVVGSTALGNRLGNEAMNQVRRAHFSRGRELVKTHEGYEIKTIGDSFMVAFRTALEAFNFALDLHNNTGHAEIQIRAGIHVGTVRIEEEDAYGAMVNYTARVESMAEGAEVWVSDRAKLDIAEDAERDRPLRWNLHPNCDLKGFRGKHKLWSLANPKAAGGRTGKN